MPYFMMGTNPSPEKKAQLDALSDWVKTLPAEKDGLVMSHDGYHDEHGNMIRPFCLKDIGLSVDALFDSIWADFNENDGFGN